MAQDLCNPVTPQTSLTSQGMKQDEQVFLGWTKGFQVKEQRLKLCVCRGVLERMGKMTSITFLSLSCFPESLEPK